MGSHVSIQLIQVFALLLELFFKLQLLRKLVMISSDKNVRYTSFAFSCWRT